MNILQKLLIPLSIVFPILLTGCTEFTQPSAANLSVNSENHSTETVLPISNTEVLSLAQQPALQDLTFTLINNTGYTLREFYAPPSRVGDWEEDILGANVLPPGYSGNITIADGRSTCTYDLLSVFSNAGEVVRWNVNLCALNNGTYNITDN